ncbi:hypothetical protein BD413DRAFT_163623 [Trametes elegans]|nr:hypothetical protein BD413DRAFT_163623 [Trametes elegans]
MTSSGSKHAENTATPSASTDIASLNLYRIDSSDDGRVENILTLSNFIFAADDSTKHGSLPYWRRSLSHPSAFILFLASESRPDTPVAFLFVIPRTYNPPLRSGATDGLHIWLAGVRPTFRSAGCLTTMVRQLGNIGTVTVCTFPSRFPDMWNWLTRRGWLLEQELEEGKVMFSRPLPLS